MLFFTNNVLKITDLFLYNVGIFMYKLSTNDLPDVFLPMFRRNNEIHTYPTRQRQSFHLLRARTVFAQKTITYNGPRFWNDLPNELIVSPSFRIFERKLKTFLLGRYKWNEINEKWKTHIAYYVLQLFCAFRYMKILHSLTHAYMYNGLSSTHTL